MVPLYTYWFVFTSDRRGLPPWSSSGPGTGYTMYAMQIYVAAVIVSGTSVTATGAILLPQSTGTINLHPRWQ